MKEQLISEIRRLTKRIGQATRSGVSELAERLRIARTELAVRLARDHDTWLLVNAQGKTEFVDPETWKRRVKAWQQHRSLPVEGKTPESPASPEAGDPAPATASPAHPVREFFGEPISVYTREQALSDGVLIDVTRWASGCFRNPVALTQALWETLSDLPEGQNQDTLGDRVKELLRAAMEIARGHSHATSQLSFPFLIATKRGLRSLELLAHSGPGDRGEPVITIGFPSDF